MDWLTLAERAEQSRAWLCRDADAARWNGARFAHELFGHMQVAGVRPILTDTRDEWERLAGIMIAWCRINSVPPPLALRAFCECRVRYAAERGFPLSAAHLQPSDKWASTYNRWCASYIVVPDVATPYVEDHLAYVAAYYAVMRDTDAKAHEIATKAAQAHAAKSSAKYKFSRWHLCIALSQFVGDIHADLPYCLLTGPHWTPRQVLSAAEEWR